MAEKEKKAEKGKETEKEEKGKGAKDSKEGKPESSDKAAGRSKRTLMIGILGIFLAAGGTGGFFVYKMFAKKPTEVSIQATEGAAEGAKPAEANAHGAAPADQKKEAAPAHGAAPAEAHGAAPAEGTGEKGGTAAGGQAKSAESHLFAIPKMEVNVGSELDRGFVRIAVAIQYEGDAEQENELKKGLPILQDVIISEVGKRRRAELLRDSGKKQLRNDLVHEFQRRLSRPIKEVFLTDFLVE